MRSRSNWLTPILTLALAFGAGPTAAGGALPEAPGRLEITPSFGLHIGGRFQTDAGDLIIPTGAEFGGTIGYRASPDMVVELLYSRQATSLELEEVAFGSRDPVMDMVIHYGQVGAFYEHGVGRVRPFISGGMGFVIYKPESVNLRSERRFCFNLGGGARAYITKRVGLRFQARGWFASPGRLGQRVFCETTEFCPVDEQGNLVTQGEASTGLFLRF